MSSIINTLSPIQQEELNKYPAPFTPRDEKQLLLRQEIGKIICDMFIEQDDTMTPEVKELYKRYPMWKFYTEKDPKYTNTTTRRMYGIAAYDVGDDDTDIKSSDNIDSDKDNRLHMVSARFGWINAVVGGVECKSVEPLTAWSKDHIEHINSCFSTLSASNETNNINKSSFLDPLGFLYILQSFAR